MFITHIETRNSIYHTIIVPWGNSIPPLPSTCLQLCIQGFTVLSYFDSAIYTNVPVKMVMSIFNTDQPLL